ncbi:MAG: electron transport complex subunit RsxG [Chromatiaceae bacterium]|nr:electron transport complex subunit RsxG [Chromatiaceae bacterium]
MSTVANPSYRQRVGYQAGLLGGFTLIAAALLVIGDLATHEAIALRKAEDLTASLAQVIPPALHDNDLLADVMTLTDGNGKPLSVYRAAQGSTVSALAYRVVGQGYAGPIEVLLGVDAKGRILGARVLAHTETPGLGDKIELNRDDWILAFNGRTLGDPPPARWAVKKDGGDFDQFSGATITPRAVVGAIRTGLEFFDVHRDSLTAAISRISSDEPQERTP